MDNTLPVRTRIQSALQDTDNHDNRRFFLLLGHVANVHTLSKLTIIRHTERTHLC